MAQDYRGEYILLYRLFRGHIPTISFVARILFRGEPRVRG